MRLAKVKATVRKNVIAFNLTNDRKKIPVDNEFASMILATGQSQREIAEKIGVHYNTIYNW